MDRLSIKVPVGTGDEVIVGAYTPCGCLWAVAQISQHHNTPPNIEAIAREGLTVRLIRSRGICYEDLGCKHGKWPPAEPPKYTQYDQDLIEARDEVIAAIKVMARLRGQA